MVLVLKYRKCVISDEVFSLMKDVCRGLEERYYFQFDAIGHENNHIHILVRAAPRYSPSKVMQTCKSHLAIQIFRPFPKLREEVFWGGKFWSGGGHIDTVGDGRGLDDVKKYIQKQGRNTGQLRLFEFN